MIAFYLPQFTPVAENDEWWGPGFTEWRHVAKARPMFRGHYQPRLPADLGFYDLRVSETREAQASLARDHGIEGFCYWHYWFAGKRLLEKPFEEVLRSGKPEFPFCLAWANATWSGVWYGAPDRILRRQTYPGREDHEAHFRYLLKAFRDERYLRVDGKPLFLVYRPKDLPKAKEVTELWQRLARKAGLKGLHLVGIADSQNPWPPQRRGFDGLAISNQSKVLYANSPDPMQWSRLRRRGTGMWNRIKGMGKRALGRPQFIVPYRQAMAHFLDERVAREEYHPCLVPNWDNTPRCGVNGFVLHDSTPELFGRHVRQTLQAVAHKPFENRLVFIKSWNEWAEGNYLEPDLRHGRAYLEVVKAACFNAGGAGESPS